MQPKLGSNCVGMALSFALRFRICDKKHDPIYDVDYHLLGTACFEIANYECNVVTPKAFLCRIDVLFIVMLVFSLMVWPGFH